MKNIDLDLLNMISGGYETEDTGPFGHGTFVFSEEEVKKINQKYNVELEPNKPYSAEYIRQLLKNSN